MCKCKVKETAPEKNAVVRLFGGTKKTCTVHNRTWYGTAPGGCCALSEKEFNECNSEVVK
jgi:hypothetical protein